MPLQNGCPEKSSVLIWSFSFFFSFNNIQCTCYDQICQKYRHCFETASSSPTSALDKNTWLVI